MDKPQPNPARQRLQALLAVPEGQRTEAQWDELHELEITLAPGNREGAPLPGAQRNRPAPGGQFPPGAGAHRKKPGKKFHRRPLKRNAP